MGKGTILSVCLVSSTYPARCRGGKAEGLRTEMRQIKTKAASDQRADDSSVRSLLNNYMHDLPIVLLADDKYALFPYDLRSKNYTYIVLGFYKIVHAWCMCLPLCNVILS